MSEDVKLNKKRIFARILLGTIIAILLIIVVYICVWYKQYNKYIKPMIETAKPVLSQTENYNDERSTLYLYEQNSNIIDGALWQLSVTQSPLCNPVERNPWSFNLCFINSIYTDEQGKLLSKESFNLDVKTDINGKAQFLLVLYEVFQDENSEQISNKYIGHFLLDNEGKLILAVNYEKEYSEEQLMQIFEEYTPQIKEIYRMMYETFGEENIKRFEVENEIK